MSEHTTELDVTFASEMVDPRRTLTRILREIDQIPTVTRVVDKVITDTKARLCVYSDEDPKIIERIVDILQDHGRGVRWSGVLSDDSEQRQWEKKLDKMMMGLIMEVDYDLWKSFQPHLAEEPEYLPQRMKRLRSVVYPYLGDLTGAYLEHEEERALRTYE